MSSEQDKFFVRLIEMIYKSQNSIELFTEGRNFVQEIVDECFRKKIPLGNHRLGTKSKIKELQDIGFLDSDYAHNASLLYDIGTLYTHQKKKNGEFLTRKDKDKIAEQKCHLFQGTPSGELLRKKKVNMYEKYSEATINTLNEMKIAVVQNRKTMPLGKVLTKNEAQKILKKKSKSKKK
jgi:hypothetical protein